MNYELLYQGLSNSQTGNDIAVNLYKHTDLINLSPLELANAIADAIEDTPDSEFSVPPPPAKPTIDFFKGVSGGKHYLWFHIGDSVNEGDTFTMKFNLPFKRTNDYPSGNDANNITAKYVATATDTASTVATFLVSIVEPQLTVFPAHAELTSPNRVNIVKDVAIRDDEYDFDTISCSAIANPKPRRPHASPYVAIPFTSQYQYNSFFLSADNLYTPVESADANGQGNHPTITVATYLPTLHQRLWIIKLGADIKPHNLFTIQIQGATIVYEVPEAQGTRELTLTSIKRTISGDSNLWAQICTSEVELTMYLKSENPLDVSEFMTPYYDDWKIVLNSGNTQMFTGFIMPDECSIPYKAKPYPITVKATDGLGLLKDVALVDLDGNDYGQSGDTLRTAIELISGILKQTSLNLPIRTFASIYHISMADRFDDIKSDFLNQVQVCTKTFLKDSKTYVDCNTALQMLLPGFRIWQSEGFFNVLRIAELGNQEQGFYYTTYSPEGIVTDGGQIADVPMNISTGAAIEPLKTTNLKSPLTYKSVKTSFKREKYAPLISNTDLARYGDLKYTFSAGDRPGTELSAGYELLDWGQFNKNLTNEDTRNAKPAFIQVIRDEFEYEVDRFLVVPNDRSGTAPRKNYIRTLDDKFKVITGDTISVSVDWRFANLERTIDVGFGDPVNVGPLNTLTVALLKQNADGTDADRTVGASWWLLGVDGIWYNMIGDRADGMTFAGVANQGDEGNDLADGSTTETKWQTGLGVQDSKPFPVDGTIYVLLSVDPNISANNSMYFKNVAVTLNAKKIITKANNDYWITIGDTNIKDTIDEEIKISDVNVPSLKGALYTNGGTLTTAKWYKQGLETKLYHFKELHNITKWMQSYKRARVITGDFRGFMYAPENNPTAFVPASFYHKFVFSDDFDERIYVMMPPISVDLIKGTMQATFQEFNMDDENTGSQHTLNYDF